MNDNLIVPVYVESNALLDLLASVEGGFSLVEKVTSRTSVSSEKINQPKQRQAPNLESLFITSDNPCVWFDPANYQNPRPFGTGGLISLTLEITLPLSPKQMLFWGSKLIVSDLYIPIENEMVDSLNKRTRLFSDEFFVSNNSKVKPS